MAISQAEARAVALDFCRDYPGALAIAYQFRDTISDLYADRADQVPASMKGGYASRPQLAQGKLYRGRVDVVLANIVDGADLLLKLKHEVFGHYGSNTFDTQGKRALLDGLLASRDEPSLRPLWADVDRRYADRTEDVRAEEVFALVCEGVEPRHHLVPEVAHAQGQRAFADTCVGRSRRMTADDVTAIACMVAQGLKDRTREQKHFPQTAVQFWKEGEHRAMEPKKPFHEVVAQKLIEQLEAGTAPFQKPWDAGEASSLMPMNPTTGKRYKGINAIHLMSQGRDDQRWMTYKQAAAIGAQVRKGERGTMVQYWRFHDEHEKRDEAGRPVLDAKGQPVKEIVKLERPRVFFAVVFNSEQIDGLPAPKPRPQHEWSAIERAEHILQASGAAINHVPGDRAFYRPSTDSITLPERGQFSTAARYYATALHELGHWTGHESRLNRDLANPFGSEAYAREELRAEIASMIVGDELGIGHDPGQHAAYVGSWIKALREDPLEIFRAAADAEKIQDFVLAFEQKQVQALEQHDGQVPAPQQTQPQPDLVPQPTPNEGRHPSDLTMEALVQHHGWEVASESRQVPGRVDSVRRTFDGVGPLGTMVTPNGERRLYASYADDREQRRHITLKLGDQLIASADGSDRSAVDVAREINAHAERFADERRAKQGLEPIYSTRDAAAATPEGAGLAEALRAVMRETRLLGPVPDPVAQDVLKSPSLDALERELAASGVRGLKPLGAGASSVVLDAGDRVVRIGLGEDIPRPSIPEVLQPSQHGTVGGLRYEVLPKAETAGITAADVETLAAQLAARGYDWGDAATDNAGRHNGKLVVTDPGGVVLAREDQATARIAAEAGISIPEASMSARKPDDAMPDPASSDLQSELLAAYPSEVSRGIEAAAAARRGYAAGSLDSGALALAEREHLGLQLPANWSGELEVVGVAQQGGVTVNAAQSGLEPAAYEVFARLRDVPFGSDAFALVAATRTASDAADLTDRLRLVHALSAIEEEQKALRLALAAEARVQRDPDASPEDRAAAKEARRAAEATALRQEAESQQRTSDAERQRPGEVKKTSREEGQGARSGDAPTERTYINVPYRERIEAKALGAGWDRKQQSWYIPAGVDGAAFAKWPRRGEETATQRETPQQPVQPASNRVEQARQYLAVPYEERIEAKAAGAQWDKVARSWYVGAGADPARLMRWMPEQVAVQQSPAMTVREEFAEAMRGVGLFVGTNAQGDHPIMDGKPHRVPVEGGKRGAVDGFYVVHLDGRPAGRIINNKTGVDITWKSKGYALNDQDRARLQAEAATKMAQREAEQARAQEATAQRVAAQAADLAPVQAATPYLQAKGIAAHAGALTDGDGQKTYIPAFDVDGKQWTMQYIQEDGTKRFAKDSRKEGCFHPVGGFEALAAAPALVIAEGYATAATLAQVLGHATVAAFDSGNLLSVAKSLRERYPEKPVVIAGDDDRHLVMTHGHNTGREKAEAAAQAAGGRAVFPVFAPSESQYPADLPPITPEAFRAHLRAEQRIADAAGTATLPEGGRQLDPERLSDAQLQALGVMKRFTDFNDLQSSAIGRAAAERQIRSTLSHALRREVAPEVEEQRQMQQLQHSRRRSASL